MSRAMIPMTTSSSISVNPLSLQRITLLTPGRVTASLFISIKRHNKIDFSDDIIVKNYWGLWKFVHHDEIVDVSLRQRERISMEVGGKRPVGSEAGLYPTGEGCEFQVNTRP